MQLQVMLDELVVFEDTGEPSTLMSTHHWPLLMLC